MAFLYFSHHSFICNNYLGTSTYGVRISTAQVPPLLTFLTFLIFYFVGGSKEFEILKHDYNVSCRRLALLSHVPFLYLALISLVIVVPDTVQIEQKSQKSLLSCAYARNIRLHMDFFI